MKPRAASCAVGSELGLLFTFHKSREPVNPGSKAQAPCFTVAGTACTATAGHCLFYIPWPEEQDHIVLLAAVEYLIMSESVNARVRICTRPCLHVVSWRTIKWQDELWSMSCRQNTSALVESESPDGPSPFQATGAGAPQHKECSVSVRIPPRTPARALLTSTTPGY